MSEAVDEERSAEPVAPLDLVALTRLGEHKHLRRIATALGGGSSATAGNLWGSSQAAVLAALIDQVHGPWCVVLSTEAEAETFADDLLAIGLEPELLPTVELGKRSLEPALLRQRLEVAQRLSGPAELRPRLLVTAIQALLEPIPDTRRLEREFLRVAVGETLRPNELLARLTSLGYRREPLAESPGEFSLRGDILDLYAFASERPIRIEMFDDEVESIRDFDPTSQRSVEIHQELSVCLASARMREEGSGSLPATLLAPTAIFVEVEPLRVEEVAETLRVRSSEAGRGLVELGRQRERHATLKLQSLPSNSVDFDTRSVQALSVGMREVRGALEPLIEAGQRILILGRGSSELSRLRDLLEDLPPIPEGPVGAEAGGLAILPGSIARGFRLPDAKLVVINHRELLGVMGGAQRTARPRATYRARALSSFFELKIGDLVVHAVHGLSQYAGLVRMQRGAGEEEHLHLIFADEVSLYVPASRIDLVQRYIGAHATSPPLDKVGGQSFRKRKEKVERAVQDLAADLLEVQARREMQKRDAWEVDSDIVRDVIDAFPHTDTVDQAEVDDEIHEDLTSPAPMDRLLCGDVGFGKTELAVRAAARVASAGGQVAVLVPTTVLAEQHARTFRQRLAGLPIEVAAVSRFVRGKDAKTAIAGVADGSVDILVGTHRLLSKDVQFKRLGLLIIDEEQRFGVTHKEHFKQMRATTDVLAMSATPIPRTLHMSLSGLRDISALTVPPDGRQEIDTKLVYDDDRQLLRDALLREKTRGGQVFFLHNRVQSIHRIARELQELVPECSYAVGHGQQSGRELSAVMKAFIAGDVDVLVATTIVENGIDVPAAGTIIIDQADMFGLSELHQLRGRVGRGSNSAFCYLMIDRNKPLREIARERLKALEEMTQLGSGFGISMKDLEIRGAGNLLGPEQSGHIAAVGYDMYCRLLKQTVDRLRRGESATPKRTSTEIRGGGGGKSIEPSEVELSLGVRAFLPDSWIPAQDTRLEVLRTLDAIRSEADADEVESMLRDRFGRLPEEARALARQFRLRLGLAQLGIRSLAHREDTYLVEYEDRVVLEGFFASVGKDAPEARPLRAGQALWILPAGRRDAASALDWVEGLLMRARTTETISAP